MGRTKPVEIDLILRGHHVDIFSSQVYQHSVNIEYISANGAGLYLLDG